MSNEIRAICPECSSITQSGKVKGKFYVNSETLMGYCHHCGFKGKFNAELIDQLEVVGISEAGLFQPPKLEPLSPEAKRYLSKRFPGVNLDQLEAFGIAYNSQLHAIAIPTYQPNSQKLQGVKYRLLASKDQRYHSEKGSVFGGYWLSGKNDKLLIVEGEFDAITAKLAGFTGSILALQTNKLSNESVNRIRSFESVFLCLDSDQGGEEGIRTIEAIFQGTRELNIVKLPSKIKDLNELLQSEGSSIYAVDQFLRRETKTEIEKSTQRLDECISEITRFLSEDKNVRGFTTGFETLDKHLGGGLRPGEMTVVHARQKVGKTTFINNLVHNLAKNGIKSGIASFEMSNIKHFFPTMISIAGAHNIRHYPKEKISEAIELITTNFTYLQNLVTYNKLGRTKWEMVEKWIRYVHEQYGVFSVVLDHTLFLLRKVSDVDENYELAERISKLARELDIHPIVVVQAPKSKDELSIQTGFGGTAWGSTTDNFITLERNPDNRDQLIVDVVATRSTLAPSTHDKILMSYSPIDCALKE